MSAISKGAFRFSATATVDDTVWSRRRALVALMAGIPLVTWGCDNSINRPAVTLISQDLPVTVKWTVNSETPKDATTVFTVSPESPILVTGELLAKSGISFARCPKGFILAGGFDIPPLPMPKNYEKPYNDKPDDLHVFMLLFFFYVRGQNASKEEPIEEGGPFNQIATFDQKELRFSGGILAPKQPGRYALRMYASFKQEKECKSQMDRISPEMSSIKVLAESTIQVE